MVELKMAAIIKLEWQWMSEVLFFVQNGWIQDGRIQDGSDIQDQPSSS